MMVILTLCSFKNYFKFMTKHFVFFSNIHFKVLKYFYILCDYHLHVSLLLTRTSNLSIQFSVIGCKFLRSTQGYTVKHEGERVKLTCNATGVSTYLTCKNNEWSGDFKNCSAGISFSMLPQFG